MNLFPLQTNLPNTYTDVSQRVDQLRFGNRLRQDASTARQFNKLISVIKRLAALVPQLPSDVNELLANYKIVEPIEISLSPADSLSDPYGFHDFSQRGIEARRDRGKAITEAKLRPLFADKIAA